MGKHGVINSLKTAQVAIVWLLCPTHNVWVEHADLLTPNKWFSVWFSLWFFRSVIHSFVCRSVMLVDCVTYIDSNLFANSIAYIQGIDVWVSFHHVSNVCSFVVGIWWAHASWVFVLFSQTHQYSYYCYAQV